MKVQITSLKQYLQLVLAILVIWGAGGGIISQSLAQEPAPEEKTPEVQEVPENLNSAEEEVEADNLENKIKEKILNKTGGVGSWNEQDLGVDDNFFGAMVAIVAIVMVFGIPLAVILTPLLIVLAIVFYLIKVKSQRMKTIATLAEKGAPIPPNLMADSLDQENRASYKLTPPEMDMRKGVIWACSGVGICLFLLLIGQNMAFGLIPVFIGAGYLVSFWLAKRWGSGGNGNIEKKTVDADLID